MRIITERALRADVRSVRIFQNSPHDLSAFWRPLQGSKVMSFSTSVHVVTTWV